MYTVIKTFPLGQRRLRPGDTLGEHEHPQPDLLDTLVKLGYLEHQPDAQPAAAPAAQ
jgi:hypothetical protein